MFNVIVSGSDGFIAKHLISKLSKRKKVKIIKMGKNFGDISNKNTWSKLPAANTLIHLAGQTFVPKSWSKPGEFFRSNVLGTIMALEYCRTHNVKLIFISSYLYGNADKFPTNEKAKIKINNPLALTKMTAEEICKFYSKHYGLKIIILRPSNIYGPNQKDFWLIPEILNKFKKKTIIVNNFNIKRDLIYVVDLVEAIIKSIYLKNNFEIFNIGSGKNYSIRSIIHVIQKIYHTKISVKNRNIVRRKEILQTKLDIKKAKKILKWKPIWSLEEGLRYTIKKISN